jgi:hypothetical protein
LQDTLRRVDRDYGSGITTHRRRINRRRRRRRRRRLENAHGGGRHVSPSSSFSFVSLFLNKSVYEVCGYFFVFSLSFSSYIFANREVFRVANLRS